MTNKEKRRFVREMMSTVTKEVLANIPKMPEYWNGKQLRQYIADRFQDSCMTMSKTDKHSYTNEVIVRNL